MKTTTIRLFGLVIVSSFCAAALDAQIVTYNFTGAAGNQATQPTASVAANVTASVISRGSGVTANSAGSSISSNGWTTAASIDVNDYYEFSITPASGYRIDVGTLSFAERRSNTGIRNWEIRTSLNSFSTVVGSASVPDNDLTRNQSVIFGDAYNSISSTLTIRIYGFAAEAGTGTWRLANNTDTSNMQLTGTVSAIPEPSTFAALLGLTALAGVATRRRRVAV